MPAFVLPLRDTETPTVCAEAEGLNVFLAPVGDPLVEARIGTERTVFESAQLVITTGEKFQMNTGWVRGHRYLAKDETGAIVGSLNVTEIRADGKNAVVASNVFVAPAVRRQGIAAGLLQRAKADYPKLTADNALSVAGAALVGYSPAPAPTRRPRLG